MLEQIAALFATHTQSTRLLRLTTPLGMNRLLAESVHGEEAINQAYTFTITALSLDAGISLRTLLGQPALLQLLTVDRQAPRSFHGYLTAIERNGANGGMARYTLTLQPWTVFLGLTRDSRIFQQMTVPDILDAVFCTWRQRGGKLAPAWRFAIADRGSYPVRSLSTQYQESDLAFAERLMNEAGLFYFFEHEADINNPDLGRHQLVIAQCKDAARRCIKAVAARHYAHRRMCCGKSRLRRSTVQHERSHCAHCCALRGAPIIR